VSEGYGLSLDEDECPLDVEPLPVPLDDGPFDVLDDLLLVLERVQTLWPGFFLLL